jgi:hypothetical protein
VGESGEWSDVEDGVRVFAVLHTAFGEDDGDEVDAGVGEERDGRGVCEELQVKSASVGQSSYEKTYASVDMANVANDIVVAVEDWEG